MCFIWKESACVQARLCVLNREGTAQRAAYFCQTIMFRSVFVVPSQWKSAVRLTGKLSSIILMIIRTRMNEVCCRCAASDC